MAIGEITFSGQGAPGQSAPIVSSSLLVWNYATRKTLWRVPMTRYFFCDWSPDGRLLATIEEASEAPAATLRIFDADGDLQKQASQSSADRVSWAPDSQKIAIANGNIIQILRLN